MLTTIPQRLSEVYEVDVMNCFIYQGLTEGELTRDFCLSSSCHAVKHLLKATLGSACKACECSSFIMLRTAVA
jgi:hypothetical protein